MEWSEAAQPAAMPERISARSSSISLRPFLVSTCQKVQPLQASEPLRERADAVDRADLVAEHDGAVGAHQRAVTLALGVDELCAGRDHAALDQLGEGDARRLARGHERRERRFRQRLDRGDARLRPPLA